MNESIGLGIGLLLVFGGVPFLWMVGNGIESYLIAKAKRLQNKVNKGTK